MRQKSYLIILRKNIHLKHLYTIICFPKNAKSCSHVWASARDLGTQIYWDECDIREEKFIDTKCNVIEDEEKMNCKLYPTETNKSK